MNGKKNTTESLRKRILPFASLSIALVLSVICYSFLNHGTAWFAENSSVSGGGMELSIQKSTLNDASVTIHNVIGMTEAGDSQTLYFDKAEGVGALPKYDILDHVNRHVLMRIELPAEMDITLTAVSNDGSHFMDGKGGHSYMSKKGNFITNILAFTDVSASAGSADYTPEGGSATQAYTVTLDGSADSQSFVYKDESGDMQIAKSLSLFEGTPYAEGEKFVFYLLISYSEENITALYSENIGNEAIAGDPTSTEGDDSVGYIMDFVFNLGIKEE